MTKTRLLKIYLAVAGLLLTAIGGSTLIMPETMKASSGIDLANNISLLNDVRASAGLILGLALLSITGAFSAKLRFTSGLTTTLLFFSLALGRAISILVDGMPFDGMVKATGLELILGIVGLILMVVNRKS